MMWTTADSHNNNNKSTARKKHEIEIVDFVKDKTAYTKQVSVRHKEGTKKKVITKQAANGNA